MDFPKIDLDGIVRHLLGLLPTSFSRLDDFLPVILAIVLGACVAFIALKFVMLLMWWAFAAVLIWVVSGQFDAIPDIDLVTAAVLAAFGWLVNVVLVMLGKPDALGRKKKGRRSGDDEQQNG